MTDTDFATREETISQLQEAFNSHLRFDGGIWIIVDVEEDELWLRVTDHRTSSSVLIGSFDTTVLHDPAYQRSVLRVAIAKYACERWILRG